MSCQRATSGQQRERSDVISTHDSEMTAVEGGDLGDSPTLCGRDDRGINAAQWQIVVPRDQFRHPHQVNGVHSFEREVA